MKKFRLLNGILLLFFGLFTTSCFDILEEYEFNADGSGKGKLTIDVSRMMDMMASFAGMDSTGEAQKSMDEMFTENSAVETLKKLEGISDVKSLSDRDAKIVGYSYAFANIEALNNALAASSEAMDFASMGVDMGNPESSAGNYFVRKGNKLTRVMDFKDTDEKEEGTEEEGEQYEEMAKMMFADAKYELHYSFEQGVKKVKKSKNAVVGPDGHSVSLSVPFLDIMDKKAEMGCEILLKSN